MVLLLVVVLGLGVGTNEYRAARVMHDVVTDAAHQRAPQLALAARADDDHVDVFLLGHLAQRVARLHAALVANVNVVNLAQRIQTMQMSTLPLRMYMLSSGIHAHQTTDVVLYKCGCPTRRKQQQRDSVTISMATTVKRTMSVTTVNIRKNICKMYDRTN